MCATDVPQVEVSTTITYDTNKTHFDIKWEFHKEFVDSLTQYDLNENKIFEKNEKASIEESLVSYLEQLHYLIDIEYLFKNQLSQEKYFTDISPTLSSLKFSDKGMVYNYKFNLPLILENDHKLYINYYDKGGNFDFLLKDVIVKNYQGYKEIQPKFKFVNIYFYDYQTLKKTAQTNTNKQEETISIQPIKFQNKEIERTTPFLDYLSHQLTTIKKDLENTLKDIKENNSVSAYFWLLLFSFLYGVVHAIGPGHGKSLVSSYFISENKSYFKAFSIASFIGVVHTFSAFILTLVVFYSVGFIFNSTIANVEQISTKISAVIIISIALYLLYKKLSKKNTKFTFKPNTQQSFIKVQTNTPLHTSNISCGCGACKTTSTDLGVILAAGIIPCPGTVTIFIFTLSLGIFFVGFLSAVFMSLGMSLVIFITAIISVKLRKSTSKNHTIVKFLEYGSLIFILCLGIILFFVS